MEYSFLAGSGLKVSRLCLGTMTFTYSGDNPRTCSKAEAFKILDKFVQAGGNFLDTADVYTVRTYRHHECNFQLYFFFLTERRVGEDNWRVAEDSGPI